VVPREGEAEVMDEDRRAWAGHGRGGSASSALGTDVAIAVDERVTAETRDSFLGAGIMVAERAASTRVSTAAGSPGESRSWDTWRGRCR
jgi:hypothetical protein